MEDLENQLGILGPHHPFSIEEEKAAERKRMKDIKPILDRLEQWRYESLHAPILIGSCTTYAA